MKTSIGLIGLIFLAGWPALAFDTNVITFTNGTRVVRDAIPVRVEKSTLIYHYADGGGGMVKLAALPEELRKRFGYEEWKAAADEDEARAKKERLVRAAAAAEEARMAAAESEAAAKALEATKTCIYGKVLLKTDHGLLVDSASELRREQRRDDYRYNHESGSMIFYESGVPVFSGYCYLTEARAGMVAENEIVKCMAYPNGIASGKRTFTADALRVKRTASESEMKFIREAKGVD